MLGVYFFEPLYPFEDKMSIKIFFHFCPFKIGASVHGRDRPSRLDWPCRLAAITEGQKLNCFLCSFCLQMPIKVQKSALPTLFNFARVRAASQPHVLAKAELM